MRDRANPSPSHVSHVLTIQEAAETTGWSPRMLRYIGRIGLVDTARSDSGYRLYGAAELQRLRTLRKLLASHDIGLSDVGFALRLRRDGRLRAAVSDWLDAEPVRPDGVSAADWLSWEQDKHQRLLAAAAAPHNAAHNAAHHAAPCAAPHDIEETEPR